MVAPEITDMEAWRKAAEESSTMTAHIVKEQIGQGEDSVRKTRKVLLAMQTKRSALEHVKGTL